MMARIVLRILAAIITGYVCCVCTAAESKTPLYIGGLLPLSERDGWSRVFGHSALVGANLAIQDINSRSDVLPNYTLVLNVTDSEGYIPPALDRLYEMIYQPPIKVAIFGPMLSSVAETVAAVTGRWNIVEVTPASVSPVLSDRMRYPHIYRMVTSAAGSAAVAINLYREFGWTKVGTLHQPYEPYSGTIAALKSLQSTGNFSVIGAEIFTDDPHEALKLLKEKGVRIIYGRFREDVIHKLFCSIYQLGMYGPSYVWIIGGAYTDGWWKTRKESVSCSTEEFKKASEGYLTISHPKYGMSDKPGIGGRTPEEFRLEIPDDIGYSVSVYDRGSAAVGYDGIWCLALALEEAEIALSRRLDSYQYGDEEYAVAVGRAIRNLSLDGMSGPIQFTDGGYRIGDLLIEQHVDGQEIVVGIYDTIADYITWNIPTKQLWANSGGKPPFDSDRTVNVDILQSIPVAINATVGVLAALGMVLAVMFLVFNIWKRKDRNIMMSSPTVNNIIGSGILLAYLGVVLLGIDKSRVDANALLFICRARSWILPIAFSLAFGGMFTKMWRVYSIFIASNKTTRKEINDYHLYGIIAVLLLVDFVILIFWQIFDPINIKENRVAIAQTAEDIVNLEQRQLLYVIGTSKFITIWTMAIIIYKAFIVAFGAFLAWSTRNVKVPGLNDSYYVGLSIYNTVICCVVAVPLSVLASTVVAFALVSGLLLFCITASLCMLFIPKVIAVYSTNDDLYVQNTVGTIGTTTGFAECPNVEYERAAIELSDQQ